MAKDLPDNEPDISAELATLRDAVAKGFENASGMAKAALEKVEGLKQDVAKFGSEKGDERKSLDDLSKKWADQQSELQHLKGLLDTLGKKLDEPRKGSKDEVSEIRKAAVEHFRRKHKIEAASAADAIAGT